MDDIWKILTTLSFWVWIAIGILLWWLLATLLSHLFFAQSSDPFRAAQKGAYWAFMLIVIIVVLADWLLGGDWLRTTLIGGSIFLLLFIILWVLLRSEPARN